MPYLVLVPVSSTGTVSAPRQHSCLEIVEENVYNIFSKLRMSEQLKIIENQSEKSKKDSW
jgi:hypothetical protein